MTGRIVSLNCSNGGVPKLPTDNALVTTNGVAGDRQRNRRFHGGPSRALCLYSLELIQQLATEGHPIVPGATGENVTISGIDWAVVRRGVRLQLGDAEVEVTSFAAPCKTIRHAFAGEDFSRISEKLHPGWSRVYARVLREAWLRVGDAVNLSI